MIFFKKRDGSVSIEDTSREQNNLSIDVQLSDFATNYKALSKLNLVTVYASASTKKATDFMRFYLSDFSVDFGGNSKQAKNVLSENPTLRLFFSTKQKLDEFKECI